MTEENIRNEAKARPRYISLQAAIAAAVFSLWLYLIAAFYFKGYLHFFNADAAWFSPSPFQLVSFSAIAMAEATALLIGWIYLCYGAIKPWITDQNEDLQSLISKKGVRRLKGPSIKALIPSLWICIYALWLMAAYSAATSVQSAIDLSFPTGWDYLGYIIPLLWAFCLSPIFLFVSRILMNKLVSRLVKNWENELAPLTKIIDMGEPATADAQLMHEAALAYIKYRKWKQEKLILDDFISAWPTRAVIICAVIAFLVAVTYLAGIAQAAADLQNFGRYNAVKADDSKDSIWLIFSDGHNTLIYEDSEKINGFYFACPEANLHLLLRWPKVAERIRMIELTESRIRNVANSLVAYYNQENQFPTSLSKLPQSDVTGLDDGTAEDAWGKEIKYQILNGNFRECELRSAGPDSIFGTSDDLVATIHPAKADKTSVRNP